MLNNLKIRTKLIGLLLFPVLALLVFASVGYRQRNNTASQAQSDGRIVAAAASASTLMHTMLIESNLQIAGMISKTTESQLPAAQKATDAAFKAFKVANTKVNFSATSQGNIAKNGLQTFETQAYPNFISNRTLAPSWQQLIPSSGDAYSGLSSYVQQLGATTTTPEVVLPIVQLSAYMQYVQGQSKLSSYALIVSKQGDWGDTSEKLQDNVVSALQSSETDLNVLSGAASTSSNSNSLYSQANGGTARSAALDSALTVSWSPNVASDHLKIPSGVKIEDITDYLTGLEKFGTTFTNSVQAIIGSKKSDAAKAAQLYIVFAGLVIILAVVLAILIATSVTQRLVKLTSAADKLSHEQLPRLVDSLKNPAEEDVGYLTSSFSEIDVKGNDEIGHLATAYNRIQGVAVQVATEQAQLLRKGIGDMFVNLARRNQGLLDRQIEFIDQLESAEEDPDQLENLFRLDHLATRMRRNAESLLVLAGAEPNRRRGKPVPLADVVRAAVGEVEDFARIDMLQFDEVLVASNAALDIAHLLSELMENAANFSPPDTRVEIVGHRTKAEGYVISVTDHGIGMTPEAFAESNDLLARPPLVGLALSRSLGFIVIGRLAARFGIAVRLMPSPTSGTTAMVSLPPSLITDQPRTANEPGAITDTPPAKQVSKSTPTPDAPRRTAAPKAQATKTDAPATKAAPQRRVPKTAEPAPATEAQPSPDPQPVAKQQSTSSGLTKRVPRSEGGQRAVPGGDGQRSTTQNRRSPEEVRSMLSNYRSGMQKGRTDDDAPPTPKDSGK